LSSILSSFLIFTFLYPWRTHDNPKKRSKRKKLIDDRNDREHYEQKYKRDLLAEFYEEEYTSHISNEEDSNLYYDPLLEEKNADRRSFEYPAYDVITEEFLQNLIRENMNLLKYYRKRHIIFRKYDEGIQLDKGMYFIHFLIIKIFHIHMQM